MSYNGIGLPTPRGTGTSGHIQRNMSAVNPSTQSQRGVYNWRQEQSNQSANRESRFHRANYVERKVDEGILEHERKRAIEVECMALRDELEDGNDQEGEGNGKIGELEIERKVSELRARLKANAEEDLRGEGGGGSSSSVRGGGSGSGSTGVGNGTVKQFKSHQVHEIVRAKELENERFRLEVLNNGNGRRHGRRGYTGASQRSQHDRSLSPPSLSRDNDRNYRSSNGNGNRNGNKKSFTRERSPNGDRYNRSRRRSSVSANGSGGIGGGSGSRSRSRSPDAARYRDRDESRAENDRLRESGGGGGLRRRHSSSGGGDWRRDRDRGRGGSRRESNASGGGGGSFDSISPDRYSNDITKAKEGEDSIMDEEEEGTNRGGSQRRLRSRSPHGRSGRQEGGRDLRRRGSMYGPSDVDLNYN